MALGEIAAACKSPAADEAVAALQTRKPGKVPTLERMLAAGTTLDPISQFLALQSPHPCHLVKTVADVLYTHGCDF